MSIRLEVELPPSQIYSTLSDKNLWANLLAPGLRSGIWKSNTEINDLYEEEQKIHFCYANVGSEIVRLEFPAWMAQEQELLDRSIAITLSQVEKGFGYPIILTEAYHQASIRGYDRTLFFAWLERELVRKGFTKVGTSFKQTRKQIGVA